jgi:nicotinamidase-related amidase
MPTSSSPDLHGNAPDHAPIALLLIDVINDLDFEGHESLLEQALPMAERIAELKRRARAARVPVVYVNDNFGQWRSDFEATVAHCLDGGVPGEPIARLLAPDENDYFVLKPKHSGFYTTSLDLLLSHVGAKTLILTGMAGDICILFTAGDAYLRDYKLVIPCDCVASNTAEENEAALRLMAKVVKADTQPSGEIDFEELISTTRSVT